MATAAASIEWRRDEAPFTDNRYSRAHQWSFDGGSAIRASSSPDIVPTPMSDPSAVDPEEAFVASLSSCHMLWFLHIARQRGFVVDEYQDQATGEIGKAAHSKMAMTTVTLRPRVVFSGELSPTAEDIHAMHHKAHEECFIANSVKTEVRCEPIIE